MRSNNWNEFKNKCVKLLRLIVLVVLLITSIGVGSFMIVSPEKVNELVIKGVGLLFIFEGIYYALDSWRKYQ